MQVGERAGGEGRASDRCGLVGELASCAGLATGSWLLRWRVEAVNTITLLLADRLTLARPANWLTDCQSQRESESRYGWRSVSQSVLVSSPFWDSWPDFEFYILTVVAFVLLGAPSLTRGWVCHLSVVFVMIFMMCQNIYIGIFIIHSNICTICTRPLSVQTLWSRLCLILLNLCFDDS
jgi:hypothetical protein